MNSDVRNSAHAIVSKPESAPKVGTRGITSDGTLDVSTDFWGVPLMAISDAQPVKEPAEGASTKVYATFTVSLPAPSTLPVTVNYTTVDGSAVAGLDYVATTGMLNFYPGETSHTVQVEILTDNINEANENFSVQLSDPTNAGIAHGVGLGTILGEDAVPPPAPVNIINGGTAETHFSVRRQLTRSTATTVAISFSVSVAPTTSTAAKATTSSMAGTAMTGSMASRVTTFSLGVPERIRSSFPRTWPRHDHGLWGRR